MTEYPTKEGFDHLHAELVAERGYMTSMLTILRPMLPSHINSQLNELCDIYDARMEQIVKRFGQWPEGDLCQESGKVE